MNEMNCHCYSITLANYSTIFEFVSLRYRTYYIVREIIALLIQPKHIRISIEQFHLLQEKTKRPKGYKVTVPTNVPFSSHSVNIALGCAVELFSRHFSISKTRQS